MHLKITGETYVKISRKMSETMVRAIIYTASKRNYTEGNFNLYETIVHVKNVHRLSYCTSFLIYTLLK